MATQHASQHEVAFHHHEVGLDCPPQRSASLALISLTRHKVNGFRAGRRQPNGTHFVTRSVSEGVKHAVKHEELPR